MSSSYNPSLPFELSLDADFRRTQSPVPQTSEQIQTLKKELHDKDSTITELKNQLKSLQTIVEQLTKENSVLKTTSSIDDDQSMTSQYSMNESSTSHALETGAKAQERGRSLETDQLTKEADLRQALKNAQRPVSMYEAREGPKNNWQVTKHQVLIT